MMYFKGSWRALKATIINITRPIVTKDEQQHIDTHADRFKGSFALLYETDESSPAFGEELCIGCKMCERICPSRIITVESTKATESPKTGKKRAYASDFTLDLQACIYCELCIQVCPTDAIVFVKELQEPGFCREDLVLTMDRLYANSKKALYWGTGSKLIAMQNPKAEEADKQ